MMYQNAEINQVYSVHSSTNTDVNSTLFSQQLASLRKQNETLQTTLQKEQDKSASLEKQYEAYEEKIAGEIEGYESQIILLNHEIEKETAHIDELGKKYDSN